MQAAPILGMVSTGLQIAGGLTKSSAEAAGYRHAEAEAQRKALAARTAADQTDLAFREELDTTLGNIRAIRAAAGVTPDSPTGLAIAEAESKVSERQRAIKTGNLRTQGSIYESDAAFYGSAASYARTTGYLNAFSTGLKGLSSFSASGFGG